MPVKFERPDLPDFVPADLSGQPEGVLMNVPTGSFIFNVEFQRKLDLPRAIHYAAAWWWPAYSPVIAMWTTDGLEVVEGQHRVAAAIIHGGIASLPCYVFDGVDLPKRALASVSHARDRKAHTPGQIWRALTVAGDDEAVAVLRVCQAAGIELLPYAPAGSAYKVRQTIALAAIKRLIKRRGSEKAALVLAALADSELAPITAEAIKAAEALLCDDEYAADFDVDRLSASFRALGPKATTEAKELAAAKGLPMWRALVAVIYRHRKGRAPAPAAPPPSPLRRVIDRTPPAGPVSLGDPPAGRSALDQQRARA